MLLNTKKGSALPKFQNGTSNLKALKPIPGKMHPGEESVPPKVDPAPFDYSKYYDGDKFNQKQFFKDYPMPMPADFEKSYDGRTWDKLLSNEQRAANFFSNNPYIFNVATGQWEKGTNSDQGTTHGGNSMDYTGSTSALARPEGGMRYIINPYTGKEVGVPANKWALNIGYTTRNEGGGMLMKGSKKKGLLY